MEVSIISSIFNEFSGQQQQYGLLFGYTAGNENHLISFLVPQTFQQFGNELTEDKKSDLLNLAEDLHNSVNGYSLLGFIAKESEQINQQALTMKAQEYYVGLQKRLKMKGSFYLCYVSSLSYQIFEKKQGQVFTKVTYKEINENDLVKVNSFVPINVENVISEKEAKEKLLIDKITDESQKFLTSLPNYDTILINNILITNDQKNLEEINGTRQATLEFIESSTNKAQEQYYVRPYYFKFTGQIQIDLKVHKTLTIQNLKTIVASATRKELEARIYQVFGDQFSKKTIQDTEEIQLPAKYKNTSFKNTTLAIYISHSQIQDYGSCIYPSLQEAENVFTTEFQGNKVTFSAVDTLKIETKGNMSSSNNDLQKNEIKKSQQQTKEELEQELLQKENRKQQLSYLIFAIVIVILSYIYMKV